MSDRSIETRDQDVQVRSEQYRLACEIRDQFAEARLDVDGLVARLDRMNRNLDGLAFLTQAGFRAVAQEFQRLDDRLARLQARKTEPRPASD